jgi:phage terminase Nu1 subunit (DNA packaging protein)
LVSREVELYERLLADELAGTSAGHTADELSELLSTARARLAELEAARRTDER